MDTSGHTSLCEDYVSFETAKLLKEKGFDEKCHMCWDEVTKTMESADEYATNSELLATYISAPTLYVAMKWLRKVHEIFIRPNISFLYPIRYYCEIFCYGDNLKTQQDVTTENFESPEEACEAAIKYCLENLI